MHEYRVKYVLATKLVNELVEAADEKLLAKTIARYGRVDLLCIDLCRCLGYADKATITAGRRDIGASQVGITMSRHGGLSGWSEDRAFRRDAWPSSGIAVWG
jgi:hypothetical protein